MGEIFFFFFWGGGGGGGAKAKARIIFCEERLDFWAIY